MGAVAASIMMPLSGLDPTSISHWPSPQSATTSPASLTPIWRQPGTVHLGARSQCSFIWSHWLSSQTGAGLTEGRSVITGGVLPSGVDAGTAVGVPDASGTGVGVSDVSGVGVSDVSGVGVSVVSGVGVSVVSGVGVSDVSGTGVGVSEAAGVNVAVGTAVDPGSAVGVPGSVPPGSFVGVDGSGVGVSSVTGVPFSDVFWMSSAGIRVGVGRGAAAFSASASSSGRAHRHTHRHTQAPRICRFLTERMLNLLLQTHGLGASKAPPMI